jgi:hypothetical protein
MLQIALIILGIVGLTKRKIQISSKRELAGKPVIYLSIFYLVMAAIPFFLGKERTISTTLITIGITALVTILVIIFAKGQSVSYKN